MKTKEQFLVERPISQPIETSFLPEVATNKPNNITINQESFLVSISKDLASLGIVGLLYWANYNYIGNSLFLRFVVWSLVFLYLVKFTKQSYIKDAFFYRVDVKKIEKIRKILETEDEGSK